MGRGCLVFDDAALAVDEFSCDYKQRLEAVLDYDIACYRLYEIRYDLACTS